MENKVSAQIIEYKPTLYDRIRVFFRRLKSRVACRFWSEPSNLMVHAEREMRFAGLYDKDSDYGGMIPKAVLKMMRPFADEGHSGFSAGMTLDIFNRLARFKTLTPLTNDPEEWNEVALLGSSDGKPVYQNTRDSSWFSNDGGKTGYSVDDPDRKIKTFDAPRQK